MSALYSDTDPKIERMQIELWRQSSPTRKMHMLAQLNASVRILALAGLRSRYPDATETELRRRLADLVLGEDLARKVYGEINHHIHRESMFKVDVFLPSPRPFLQAQLERAERQTFSLETEISAKFASPEDTILAKLEWHRMGGEVSDRQWRDIIGVLKTRAGELDLDYLRKWAAELHVSDLLERALQESQ